jgi:hypothetical protein
MLFTQLDVNVPGLASLCALYATDVDFVEPYRLCSLGKAWISFKFMMDICFVLTIMCSGVIVVVAIVAGIICRRISGSLWL